MSDAEERRSIDQIAAESAMLLGRQVLGRDLTSEEAEALKTIFNAAAQALAGGFIKRMAEQVLAERREESIEEFFENKVKAD